MSEKYDPPENGTELYEMGSIAFDKGDFALALELFLKSATACPHAKTYERIGEIYLQIGNDSEAVKYLSAAVGFGRNAVKARLILANAILNFDKELMIDDAIYQLDQAIRDKPDFKRAIKLREELMPLSHYYSKG